MRFYHKLPIIGLLALSAPAFAQPAAPPVPPEQDVDDDEAQQQPPPGQQAQYAQPQGDGMPPPDPNAYQQQAQQYGYMGPHPIPYEAGQGFCYQQGAHFHDYAPFDQYLFREQGGWFYFVGDANDFGYQQQMWGYQGNHPIPGAYGGGYCFIDWPHRHHYAPGAGLAFALVGGYYAYSGPWSPWYWQMRPRYTSYYGGYYRRSYQGGIYWRTRPAAIYRPRIVVGAPGVYRPGAMVVAPGGASVRVAAPRAGVYVGAPRAGGVVRPGGGAYVGAPRPGGGAYVGAPRPGGSVYVGAPRPVGGGRPVAAPHPGGAPAPAAHVAAPHPAGHSGGGNHHR
jgi:hypothetical protein